MTLILTLGSRDHFIQVSDRRLSAGATVVDDDSGKAGILDCDDARLVFGFSGLAATGTFRTQRWLLSTLLDCGPPDFFAQPMLERLRSKLTEEFTTNPAILRCPPSERRLSVMFSGFLHRGEPPAPIVAAILTNFQHFPSGKDHDAPWPRFEALYQMEPRPTKPSASYVQRIGAWPLVGEGVVRPLRTMLSARLPPTAVVGRAIQLFRHVALDPRSNRTVGGRLSVVVLPSDYSCQPRLGYYTDKNTYRTFFPDMVVAHAQGLQMAMADAQIAVHDETGRPGVAVVPAVPRNRPCPCGSGRKYKHCHGSVKDSFAPRTSTGSPSDVAA